MCGILLIGCGVAVAEGEGGEAHAGPGAGAAASPSAADFQEGLRARGPDASGEHQVALGGGAALHMRGSLLQLRGSAPGQTPLVDGQGNALLFNGEVFGGLEVPAGANDARCLLGALGRAAGPAGVVATLSALRGPWALAYWHATTRTLWFGRDAVGRRSLLLHLPRPADGRLLLASQAPLGGAGGGEGFAELPPGLCSLQLAAAAQPTGAGPRLLGTLARHAWADPALTALATFTREPGLVAEGAEAGAAGAPAVAAASASLLAALRAAVGTRCRCIDTREGAAGSGTGAAPAPVLVLFSGGLDSTLLAALAHEALPPGVPIDLASVCFDGRGESPDRLAALDALQELRAFAPSREWRLILVDRSLADVHAVQDRLLRLLWPSDTVMDLNIGAALWMAAAASGRLHAPAAAAAAAAGNGGDSSDAAAAGGCASGSAGEGGAGEGGGGAGGAYTSAARVVLSGQGADELCGGYGRHRTRFRFGGWAALEAELALDLGRLWERNLGRDDRLVADHGREARHPFLDEGVVAAALALPLPLVADLRLGPGQGDKRLLRAALAGLGLPRAAGRAKRAIQFGSRIGRESNAALFGGTRRANAAAAGSVRLGSVAAGGGGGGA